MGIRGDNPFEANTVKGLHVFFYQKLKKPFFPHATDLMARILFTRAQDTKIDFGKELNTEAKAWKTIWSAGQGATAIDDVLPVAKLVKKLKSEFKSAIEEQTKLLETYAKD